MRPGPDSPIKTTDQVCYYDPGLGAGEVDGFSVRRIRNIVSAAVGSGIDENVIDCYEKIISYYEPGDRILLFGFSRGAYTARCVANVMNLCGIPTSMPDGSPVPKHGPKLRKIASDAVNYVYNHGNGKPRGETPFYERREELGRRFRQKYASFVPDAKEDVEGNIQPTFIGVFDTVAALGNGVVSFLVFAATAALAVFFLWTVYFGWYWPWYISSLLVFLWAVYKYVGLRWKQFKYFSPDENHRLSIGNPADWPSIWRHGHRAVWNKKNYDKWLDSKVQHARHAMAIDEPRKDFPRVGWASRAEAAKTQGRKPEWLKQIWFAGCHSDIGGSYLEQESRLSDIALDWMINELKECVPQVQINEEKLVRNPDPLGLQHEEAYIFELGPIKIKWKKKPREVESKFLLHASVLERLKAKEVAHVEKTGPYRPPQLATHQKASKFYG